MGGFLTDLKISLFLSLYLKMLSIAARSIKSSTIKSTLRPLTLVRTKVTLPELPYEYDVKLIYYAT